MNDIEIFSKAASALESGQNIALATVISSIGSTPGKQGYKMLVLAECKETIGTIGGGLIEAKIIEEARKMLISPNSRVFRFDLAATPDNEKGICGGTAEILVETFDKRMLPLFKELSFVIDNDQTGVLLSVISPDKPPTKIFLRDVKQLDANDTNLPPELITAIKETVQKEHWATKVTAGGVEVFVESIFKLPELVIFGAGHLSYYIARFAKSVHFRVTVCDDRSEYANKERFPDADNIVVEDFGHILNNICINEDSYIVIVTRGHKYDEIVLEQAVKTNARYIGMIGSKRKTTIILERLIQRGVPEKLLNRIYSPIGISIGAVTPQEIALSIICELVKIRRLGNAPKISHLTISCSRKLIGKNL